MQERKVTEPTTVYRYSLISGEGEIHQINIQPGHWITSDCCETKEIAKAALQDAIEWDARETEKKAKREQKNADQMHNAERRAKQAGAATADFLDGSANN